MTRRHNVLLILGFLLAELCSAGCSLSRADASSLISQDQRFVKTNTFTYGGTLASHLRADSEQGDFARALSSLNYMDSEGRLTQKGETAKSTWKLKVIPGGVIPDIETYEIPVGKREIVEVTGLSNVQSPVGSFVHATFTWRWAPVSDVGKEMKIDKKTHTGEALLQKFDDGWRIAKMQLEGDM